MPSTQTSAVVATATLEPTKAVTATVEPTFIPAQIPSTIHAPTAQAGWNTYVNDYLGYQFSYPPSMRVHTEGFMGMETNWPIPPGFTSDEYFTYLENIFPNNLCVLVESDAGMIAIAPPADSIGSFVVPCPGMGIGEQYCFEDTSQTFLVNGEQLQIPGKKMYRDGKRIGAGECGACDEQDKHLAHKSSPY